MACNDGITADIVSDCTTQPIGGLEDRAWIGNRNDFTFTKVDNKITDIVAIGGALLYTIDTTNKGLDAGHDLVVAEKMANRYTHYAAHPVFETEAAKSLNITNMEDVFVIVKRKNRNTGGDGTFFAYGVETGLFKTTDTRRANTDLGARNIELASREGQGEKYPEWIVFDTNEATTQALIDGLVTPA